MSFRRSATVATFALTATGLLQSGLFLPESPRSSAFASDAALKGDLAKAIRAGDLKAVKAAVEGGADVNALDERKMPPIGAAALLGKADIVDYLADKGADVDKQDGFGYTPLMCAAQRGQAETARALIQHGADPTLKGSQGSDPSTLAVPRGSADPLLNGKKEVAKILQDAIAKKSSAPAKPVVVGGQTTGVFDDLAFQTPDSKKWKSQVVSNNLVFSTDLPPPDFCTITLFASKDLPGDAAAFEKAFAEAVNAELKAKKMIKIEEDTGAKLQKQDAAEMLSRTLYCDAKDFHTCHQFIGIHAAGRFEFVAFESSGKETFDMYKSDAQKMLSTLQMNVKGK